jgi:hypothetical protein
VGEGKGGPGMCLGWRTPCPRGLDPSYGIWASFTGPVSTSELGCIQALGHISISNFIKFQFSVFSFGIIE